MIISSFNQKRRLRLCLDSLSKQLTHRGRMKYEVILADDNSDDGTLEWVSEAHPDVIVSLNEKSEEETYTLADNWNTAAAKAKGKRIAFSNADVMFCREFLFSHLDPIMQDGIVFGPSYRSAPEVEPMIDTFDTAKDAMIWLEDNKLIGKDGRDDISTSTYNTEWPWYFPFGGNFSVIREHFEGVGGFPSYKKYGAEETHMCKKIVEKYGAKVKANKNTYAVHLWHPEVNKEHIEGRDDEIRF